jgi:hypothetical protein
MRYLPTIFTGAVFLTCLIMGVTSASRLFSGPRHSFTAPGIYHYPVDKPGEHMIWMALNGVRDGELVVNDDKLPPGLHLSVTHQGKTVPVRAYNAESESTQGQSRKSVAKFTANLPGEYLISISGVDEARTFLISSSRGFILFFALIAWCGGSFLSGILFVALLLLLVTGKFPEKPNRP